LCAARNCTRDEGGPFEFGDQEDELGDARGGLNLDLQDVRLRRKQHPELELLGRHLVGHGMQREPTKLECGLLGALLASIVLAFFFWLGIELSLLTLIIR
jgi:hypothetical protein